MYRSPDNKLLAWLVEEGCTLPRFVFERVRAGLRVTGVIEVRKGDVSIGAVIDDLEVVIGAGIPQDFENQVQYIPIH